jgi:hypothetical protein
MEMGAKDEEFRGLGLTSRRNLCLHPEVRKRTWTSSLRYRYLEIESSQLKQLGQQGEERQGSRLKMSRFDFCFRMRKRQSRAG